MKKFISILCLVVVFQFQLQAQPEALSEPIYINQEGEKNIPVNFSPGTISALTNNGANPKDYEYYRQKRKSNLTAGLVTLGMGVVLSGVGVIFAQNSNSFDNDATAAILLIVGAVSGIASIPLMIISGVNGRKAKLALKSQNTGFGVPRNLSKPIMGLSISVPIGK